jgi:hypothetical protein
MVTTDKDTPLPLVCEVCGGDLIYIEDTQRIVCSRDLHHPPHRMKPEEHGRPIAGRLKLGHIRPAPNPLAAEWKRFEKTAAEQFERVEEIGDDGRPRYMARWRDVPVHRPKKSRKRQAQRPTEVLAMLVKVRRILEAADGALTKMCPDIGNGHSDGERIMLDALRKLFSMVG